MKRVARKYRLPPLEFHAVVCGQEVDFQVIGTPIVIECDGFTFHHERRAQFERERRRTSELATSGYIPLRLSRRMLLRSPAWCATTIQRADDRWNGSSA